MIKNEGHGASSLNYLPNTTDNRGKSKEADMQLALLTSGILDVQGEALLTLEILDVQGEALLTLEILDVQDEALLASAILDVQADMKSTYFSVIAALAVSTIALPQSHRAMTMKRSEFKDSELAKRISDVVNANNKRSDDITDSVNYITTFFREKDGHPDPYQDEIDAVTDPKSVLGKRSDDATNSDDITDSVNYITTFFREKDGHPDPYQDEIDAVTDPKSVLG
ncbi:MAG: hypothetical protein Q9214_006579 [Letrouitia sp. 1 TL-2023]